jgi:hypothetical protein
VSIRKCHGVRTPILVLFIVVVGTRVLSLVLVHSHCKDNNVSQEEAVTGSSGQQTRRSMKRRT